MVAYSKIYSSFFISDAFTVKGLVVTFPLDQMFNTIFITCAQYFIYLKVGFV